MTNYILTPTPKQQFFDNAGDPLVGGKLYSFEAGTTTPLATYTDSTGGSSNPNPVILDSRGEGSVWLQSGLAYKLRLTTAADVEIWTVDNVADDLLDLPAALAGSGGSALVGFIQAGAGAVAMTAQAKMRQYVNVDDYGAVGDGTTDDTSAIQAAITYAQTSGNHMEVRLSSKPYLVNGTLLVTGPVRLVGEGYLDFENARPTTRPPNGSWLIHASAAGPLIQFTGDLGKSSGLTNIAIFQTGHTTPGSGWVPAVHDWTIRNENTFGTLILDRVHFHNVYLGVYTNNSARPSYENITGQFFYRAFEFDSIFDLGKLEGLHAWTYWSENDYVLQWQQANCIAITLRRVDGLWMDRIFTFAVSVSVYVTNSVTSTGTSRVINISGLYSDFSGRALWIDSTSVAHVTIGSVFHLGQAWPPATPPVTISGSATIDITGGSNHLVQVDDFYSVLCQGSAVKVAGTNSQVWLSNTIVEQVDRAGTGAGAFYPTASNIIYGGSFPSLSKYGGGLAPVVQGTPGGTMFGPTKMIVTQDVANTPATSGATAGNLVPYTAEGETNAGVALIAKNAGIVGIGSATNALSFYAGASATKGTVTGSRGGNAALASLLTYLADRGLLTDGTTA